MAHREGIAIIAAIAGLGLAACAPRIAPPTPAVTTSPTAQPTAAPPTPSPTAPLPVGFQPEHLTAISDTDFWLVGIDGCIGACPPVILHTVNGGKTFQAVPAPPLVFLYGNPLTPGLPRVFDVRFANASDGWLFGDQLWATHDGGAHWRAINLGMTVDQLEPGANGYVYATLEDCGASGTPCAYRIMRSQAHTDAWSVISPPGAPTGRPVIGVHGDTVWVMYFNRSSGLEWTSRDDGDLWVRGSMPCEPDLGGSFDPVTNSVIWAFCATGMAGNPWISINGGVSYSSAGGTGGQFWNGAMVAALTARHAFVGTGGSALQVTTNAGVSYRVLPQFADALWVGFTDSNVGYVIGENQSSSATTLWRTVDGGVDWSPVNLS